MENIWDGFIGFKTIILFKFHISSTSPRCLQDLLFVCAPRTHRITITNFCLGKHLVSEDDLLKDQRGSPAYISPDVLSGE